LTIGVLFTLSPMCRHEVGQIGFDIFHSAWCRDSLRYVRYKGPRARIFYPDYYQAYLFAPLAGKAAPLDFVFVSACQGLAQTEKPGFRQITGFN